MAMVFIALLFLLSTFVSEAHSSLTCSSDCHFTQSFDSPLLVPQQCNTTQQTLLCQVRIIVDYNQKMVQVTFGLELSYDRKRSLNEKYDYVEEQTTINQTHIRTQVFYSCTLANQCERNFLLATVSKLIKKDYTEMQRRFMDLLISAESPSTKCKQTSESVACNGTCYGERNQFLDPRTGQVMKAFDHSTCEPQKVSPSVLIMATKLPMDQRAMLTRELWFHCSRDNCNSVENTDRIEKIVSESYRAFYQE